MNVVRYSVSADHRYVLLTHDVEPVTSLRRYVTLIHLLVSLLI